MTARPVGTCEPPLASPRSPSGRSLLGAARRAALAFHDDTEATAAVSFILTFPIFLTIVSVLVQLALMVNAKIMVTHAADCAARAAATSLPDEHPDNIKRAAWIALAPVSPQSTSGPASEAQADYDALKTLGTDVAESFPARYSYAMEATDVSWTPTSEKVDYPTSKGQEVEVTVTYQFQLTVPGAMRAVTSAVDKTIAGVKGRFWEVTAKGRAVSAHGRKTHANADGWTPAQ